MCIILPSPPARKSDCFAFIDTSACYIYLEYTNIFTLITQTQLVCHLEIIFLALCCVVEVFTHVKVTLTT